MSILIKGLEMPTSCRACHLKMNCDDCEGWECVCAPLRQPIGYLCDLLTDKRRDDCPLVHVPPHGRLIDADAVEKQIDYVANIDWNKKVGASGGMLAALEIVEDAPTIIPADPAEEGE